MASLNLKKVLVSDPVIRPKPLNFDERNHQILPVENNPLQQELNSLQQFASDKLLKIKEKKTCLMKFNFSRNHDFPPELVIDGFNDKLEVIRETKLLGLMITSDLKLAANTEFICKKAYKNLWTLRRMKKL